MLLYQWALLQQDAQRLTYDAGRCGELQLCFPRHCFQYFELKYQNIHCKSRTPKVESQGTEGEVKIFDRGEKKRKNSANM